MTKRARLECSSGARAAGGRAQGRTGRRNSRLARLPPLVLYEEPKLLKLAQGSVEIAANAAHSGPRLLRLSDEIRGVAVHDPEDASSGPLAQLGRTPMSIGGKGRTLPTTFDDPRA